MMETPTAVFKNLCKEIETELIGAKLDLEEKKQENDRERFITYMGYEISAKLYC